MQDQNIKIAFKKGCMVLLSLHCHGARNTSEGDTYIDNVS